MKVGIAQINTTVGDLIGNRRRVLDAYNRLVEAGAELVVFPELTLTGYPPRDLLFKKRFIQDNLDVLHDVAAHTGPVPAVVGFVDAVKPESGASTRSYNAVAWCAEGLVQHVGHKCLLPSYDVFDEERYFSPAKAPAVVDFKGLRIGLTICEDIWKHEDISTGKHYTFSPVDYLAGKSIDLLINLSASPWFSGKNPLREKLVRDTAAKAGCPIIYCNQVGGNDELVFDGQSLACDASGTWLGLLPAFCEAFQVIDLDAKPIPDPLPHEDIADIKEALVLGLRDYAHKSGFRKALLGLSGGIDSAVTAALAVEAFGAENVIGISLPSAISSQHSIDDAEALAKALGITYHLLPIKDLVTAAETTLAPLFVGQARDLAEENIQARSRGLLLMAVSNKFGALLLSTGNKSELSVGYCTLYGDMAGGLAVISDLPKCKVYALARYINRQKTVIPENTLDKPPSAELRPDQKDEDSLPPYPILDDILRLYVEEGLSTAEIISAGFDEGVVRDVVRKVDLNEYKRKQAAPGLKITPLAFGVGRRIPIVQKYVS
jgi:NAD+ synthase (glutamine-hydrolysing)